MKQTVHLHDFRQAFDHSSYRNSFSYEALALIFDDLTILEESSGQEIELDVCEIVGDYDESTAGELCDQYDIFLEDDITDDEDVLHARIEEYLGEHTAYVGATSDNTFVYRQF